MNNSDMPANPVKGCDDSFIECNDLNGSWLKNCKPSIGLTKREAFAMAAIQGLMANSLLTNMPISKQVTMSVLCADKLLKELG